MSDLPPDPLRRIEETIRSIEARKAQLLEELAQADAELQRLGTEKTSPQDCSDPD